MSSEKTSQSGAPENCPACGVAIAPQAVLCIACGYHLVLGHHLATNVERSKSTPLDQNPYASPSALDSDVPKKLSGTTVFDLTDAGARQAQAVVSEAQSVFVVVLAGLLCCAPVWMLTFPWYSYRLYCWHSLNARFAELRFPNGFSPHGEVAAKFQESRWRITVGVAVGFVFWMLLGVMYVSRLMHRIQLEGQ